MIRFPLFSHSKRLLRLMTAVVTATTVPGLVYAQTGAARAKVDDKNAPMTIRAEGMTGSLDREVNLEQNVEIIRGVTTINADKATYHAVEEEVEASGNIRMQHLGDRYTGESLRLKIDTGAGYITQPTYKLQRNNAQGKADRIDFESSERATVTSGTYSTCEGPDPDWYLKTDSLDLDTARDIGRTSKTIIYFKGVPILGTPFLSFPLSNARKSGVLPPTIGTTNKGGLEVSIPYYFNIAPNRDLTLYPNLIYLRGLQLGADGRYLSTNYSGQTKLEYLPNDRQTNTNRYAIASTHMQTIRPGLTAAWNFNAASDNDYPSDFSRTITNASQRVLTREGTLNYAGSFWSANALVSTHQVLQDPAALTNRSLLISEPYARMPQLNLQAGRQDVLGFDWSADSELTRFWLSSIDPLRTRGGTRFVVNPSIAYPLVRPGYFVTPKLSVNATTYKLTDPVGGIPINLTRVLPTFSLDSGLTFERQARFFGQNLTQTLEPRLFYVNTPFKDQSRYPNFDTTESDISFAQMFSENRFSGRDRIGDANQITAALISRFIEPSGTERMRLALAQRFYFNPPRVTLTTTASNETRSDVLASASGRLTSSIKAEVNLQYSESKGDINRAIVGMQWQPKPLHVLNLQYRRDVRDELVRADQLNQFEVSGQWPLAQRLYGVMRASYSIPDRKLVGGLLGLEYKADCWVFRFVGQRIPTATNQATTGFFIQLELNGLSKLGSNPLETLRSSIPGYQIVNQPNIVNP